MWIQHRLLIVILLAVSAGTLTAEQPSSRRLETPLMTTGAPQAGIRVRQTAPEYAGTDVHHSLYLPSDWEPGKTFPVLVEYTGNQHPASGSTGKVRDANLGFGLSGGRGFIWVVLPCVGQDGRENALTWWGDLEATLEYCTVNLPRICDRFGGDRDNVFLCGFSRGAIAVNFLGLANDEIAQLWKGFIAHDHYDGVFAVSDTKSTLERLARLGDRPQLICSSMGTTQTREYLQAHIDLSRITFLDVPVDQLYSIPDDKIVHPHTDLWMSVDSEYRRIARQWLKRCASTEPP